tara:strand:+ start:2127 stop:2705 length:579 start_codon:yes stop_codon:yes gene_type:complete
MVDQIKSHVNMQNFYGFDPDNTNKPLAFNVSHPDSGERIKVFLFDRDWRSNRKKLPANLQDFLQQAYDDKRPVYIVADYDKDYDGTPQYKLKEVPTGGSSTQDVPQHTETPQNKPARTKDQDIHWQVAIKGAIDILKDDAVNKEDWTYDYLLESIEKISNRIYSLIEDGPRPVYEEEPDVVEEPEEDEVEEV